MCEDMFGNHMCKERNRKRLEASFGLPGRTKPRQAGLGLRADKREGPCSPLTSHCLMITRTLARPRASDSCPFRTHTPSLSSLATQTQIDLCWCALSWVVVTGPWIVSQSLGFLVVRSLPPHPELPTHQDFGHCLACLTVWKHLAMSPCQNVYSRIGFNYT